MMTLQIAISIYNLEDMIGRNWNEDEEPILHLQMIEELKCPFRSPLSTMACLKISLTVHCVID